MITAKELAKMLGVSPSAVSIALNGREGVSDETRQKILDEAKRLGYKGMRGPYRKKPAFQAELPRLPGQTDSATFREQVLHQRTGFPEQSSSGTGLPAVPSPAATSALSSLSTPVWPSMKLPSIHLS